MANTLIGVLEATIPELTAGAGIALPALRSLALQGTPIAGRALGQISVSGAIGELPKLSANEIIRQVRSMGFGVRRKVALQTIKSIREQAESFVYVQTLKGGERPLASRIPLTDTKQRKKYQYLVRIEGTSALTGELTNQYIRINSSHLITTNAAEAMALSAFWTGDYGLLPEVTGHETELITRQNPLKQGD